VEYSGPGISRSDGSHAITILEKDHCGACSLIGFRNQHLLVACYDSNSIVELDENGKELRVRSAAGAPIGGCSGGAEWLAYRMRAWPRPAFTVGSMSGRRCQSPISKQY
jgi:hypothetical protein